MHIISKFVFIAVLAILPNIATASVESPSFSCTSTFVVSFENGYQASCDGDFSFDSGTFFNDKFISIAANGQLSIGDQAMLTAPDIRLFANNVNVYGSLSAPGGIIEINAPNSVQLGATAKIDIQSISVSVAGNPNFYVPKPSLSYSGSITVGSGAEITNGSFNSSIGLLSGMQEQGGDFKIAGHLCSCGGYPATLLPTISQVPEPTNLSLLGMGLFCVGLLVRRKIK